MNSTNSKPGVQAWIVTSASVGINLALGILYAWSIFKEPISASIQSGGANGFNWNMSSINDPYAVSCLAFAFAMIPAGWIQDKAGPRITALIGAVLVGAGLLLTSITTSYGLWLLGFGVMVGVGIGFGYACTTPVALKWFPPSMTGLAAGIVVSGAGLAPVYMAPLANWLLNNRGLDGALQFFGFGIFVAVALLAFFIKNPPEIRKTLTKSPPAATAANLLEPGPGRIIKSGDFWQVWLLYFAASGAGLMVIGSITGMAKASMGELAFLAVAVVAFGNAAGRIAAGYVSDKIGRENTMIIVLLIQAALMFLAVKVIGGETGSAFGVVLLATFIGFNYGTNLSLFPALAKDLWGLKNFGANYGILFTAWGAGGFVMARVSQTLNASGGGYDSSFVLSGIILLVAAGLACMLKARLKKTCGGEIVKAV